MSLDASNEFRHYWWSFKHCGQHVAFFSERKMAEWYANLYAMVAKRDSVPEIIPVYRIEVIENERKLDSTPSTPWKTM